MDRLKTISADEPALIRAAWTAIVAVLAGLGVTVSQDVDGWVQVGVLVVAALLPIVQGVATRAKVTPTVKLGRAPTVHIAGRKIEGVTSATIVEDELQ